MKISGRNHALLLGVAAAATACKGDADKVGVFDTNTGGTDSSASATASGTSGTGTGSASDSNGGTDSGSDSTSGPTSDSTDGSTSSGGTGDIKFDIGGDPDIPGQGCTDPENPECKGCTAVDILFIVDNSGSMEQHKPAVVAAFDPFVEEMVSALPPATSLHVGVTRATGFYDPGNGSGWGNGCEASFVDGTWYPPDVGNNMTNGQQGRLWEENGQRYFELETGQDSTPLKTWFEAALAGAIAGDDHSNTETVVAGAAYPFHPVNATHNMGFMREQAVLVLFLLSDAPDMTPKNVPTQDFIDIVSDAKQACGDMCILTTGAIAGGCYDTGGITNTRLYDFMNGFGQAPPSYVEFGFNMTPAFEGVLGTALSDVIATTCEQIPPQG